MEAIVIIIILIVMCTSFIGSGIGGYFAYKNSTIADEGQAVSCLTDTPVQGGIFRFVNGKINWYPNPDIANSWDKNWSTAKAIACKNIIRGPDMTLKA